jgi:hypothetical protein
VMKNVNKWCVTVGFSLATDKTEIIMITGMRVPRIIKLRLAEMETQTKEAIAYLGVIIKPSPPPINNHIAIICGKAAVIVDALRSILPNVNGPQLSA